MCVTSDYVKTDTKVCAKHIINIQHGFRNYSCFDAFVKHLIDLGDYLCVVGPKYSPHPEDLKSVTIIPSGYLGFDKSYECILKSRERFYFVCPTS